MISPALKTVMEKAGQHEDFFVTENQIYNTLMYFSHHFECLNKIKDAGKLHEACLKLSKEIKDYKYHELRDVVSFLSEKLPADKLF